MCEMQYCIRFCSNSVCNNFFKRHLQNILMLYVYIIIMQLFCNEVIILIKKQNKNETLTVATDISMLS